MREIGISSKTTVDWFSFYREVLVHHMECASKLGGPGVIVEIDEAKFGRRKYNRGKRVDGQWVFGGIERESKRLFVIPVERRDKPTLLALIKKWIHPGSTIHSDCWKSYDCLAEEGYLHHTVNHSENFINPVDGTHTNNIERVWRDIRFTIPRFGVSKDHFPGYLAEFLFKREFRKKEERMHHFFIAAANLYPPNCWSVYYSPLIPAIRMRLLCIITKE